MQISIDTLRIGHKYIIQNNGERTRFILQEIVDPDCYQVKDLDTLETFNLFEITRYGKGKDYALFELEEHPDPEAGLI